MTASEQFTVLAIDDEPSILKLIELELSGEGFRVLKSDNATEALELVEESAPDLILLDILMPGTSGIELFEKLRARLNTPIIFVTAKDADSDKVQGLDLGADDYIVKPFNPEELTARVRAILRRHTAPVNVQRTLRSGDIEIDLERRLVWRKGEIVDLSGNEWRLLQHLAANAGRVIQSKSLLAAVWGTEYQNDNEYLRVWVSRLRRKLGDDPSNPAVIKTRARIGYMLDAEPISNEGTS